MKNKRIQGAIKIKHEMKVLKKSMADFIQKIKTMEWKALKATKLENGNSINYTITLNDELVRDFKKMSDSISSSNKYSEVFHQIIYGHPEDPYDEIEWSIDIRPIEDNRIHINGNGLPFSLREIGLGKKIYKKIINEVGYISTREDKSYKYSDLLWESLIRDEELYCFISTDKVIAVLKNNIPNNIYDVLQRSFGQFEKGDCLFTGDFCTVFKNEIKEHGLDKYCKLNGL